MRFKLIVAMVDDSRTEAVLEAARGAGATGATVITSARGEGVDPRSTFLGLSVEGQRDVILLMVEEHMAREILETIEDVGEMRERSLGIALQIDVEDAVGVAHHVQRLAPIVEDEI